MSSLYRNSERRKYLEEFEMQREDLTAVLERQSSLSAKPHLEHEKKMRREIANSNERRRMQSINAGFQSLKALIPHQDGEKLSKAAILQQTAEYIQQLEQEKTKLLSQNNQLTTQLKRLLGSQFDNLQVIDEYKDSPPPKRKKRDTAKGLSSSYSLDESLHYNDLMQSDDTDRNKESSDEGITADYDDITDIKREMIELRCQLDRERRMRMRFEDHSRTLESQIFDENPHPYLNMQVKMKNDKIIYMKQMKSEEEEKLKSQPISESMSRRNLETIVEAIRHLEGDRITIEDRTSSHHIPQSEESEKESSVTCSEAEDLKSECSDRDSPLQYVPHSDSRQSTLTEVHPHLQHSTNFHEKYPIATNLLHRSSMVQYYCRPNVIVQKS